MVDKYIFSAEQDVGSGGAATVISTNVADLGALTDDRGIALTEFGPEGNKIMLEVRVGATAFAGGTSVQVKLQDSADNSTFADLTLSAAILTASLVAGALMMKIALPSTLRRYIRLAYVVAGTMSAGTVNAHLRYGAQSQS